MIKYAYMIIYDIILSLWDCRGRGISCWPIHIAIWTKTKAKHQRSLKVWHWEGDQEKLALNQDYNYTGFLIFQYHIWTYVSSKWCGMALSPISRIPYIYIYINYIYIYSVLIIFHFRYANISQLSSDKPWPAIDFGGPTTAPLSFTPGMVPGTGLITGHLRNRLIGGTYHI